MRQFKILFIVTFIFVCSAPSIFALSDPDVATRMDTALEQSSTRPDAVISDLCSNDPEFGERPWEESAIQDVKLEQAIVSISCEQTQMDYDEEEERKAEELRKKIEQQRLKKEADRLKQLKEEAKSNYSEGNGEINIDFIWPHSTHKVVSGFGKRNTGIPGASTNHKGIDISSRGINGTDVWPSASGVVMKIDEKGSTGRGKYVQVYHGNGVSTIYQHLSAITVQDGEMVAQGKTVLGKVGSTGVSSGPHLHFEILINGTAVDPLQYLP